VICYIFYQMSALSQPEPILTAEAVSAWLRWISRDLAGNVERLETMEDWTLDRDCPRFLDALTRLSLVLQTASKGLANDSDWTDMVLVLAYTSTGRSLRIMAVANARAPGFDEQVAQHSVQLLEHPLAPEAKVILGRIKALVRLECYQRVFGENRRKQALEVLETLRNEDIRRLAEGAL